MKKLSNLILAYFVNWHEVLSFKKVKEFANKEGVDLVGIASVERFKDAPAMRHPLEFCCLEKGENHEYFRFRYRYHWLWEYS